MQLTRLSQIAIGEQAYDSGDDIVCTVASWGWQALPATVVYEEDSITRLGQIGVGIAAYGPTETTEAINVVTIQADWGWQGFDVTLPAENVYTTTGTWGWMPQAPTLCSQLDLGYAYSFNGRIWPTCVFNDHVFGERAAVDLDLKQADWGWQGLAAAVSFEDPILVTTTKADWGWFGVPVGVSYSYDIQTTIGTWGWTSYPATVSLPYEIVTTQADWGWRGNPVGVSFETNVGATIGTWGWTAYPVTVDVPALDIVTRWGNWGWQGLPATVRQTTLVQGDIEAIAEAVWQKMLNEGAVQQWLEVWQRQGSDAGNPQTYPPKPGGNIEVGQQTILTERLSDGSIRHTRQ